MYLYIMSRPHSGSTILDILLGNSGVVSSVGQLVSDMGEAGNPCACGALIGACPFWAAVRARFEEGGRSWQEAAALSARQANIKSQLRTRLAADDDPAMRELAAATRAIEDAILAESGRAVLCDSTKEPTRALFLMRYRPDVRFVHLVRDPRAAVASHYWRLKDKGFYHFLRRDWRQPRLAPFFLALAALSWTVGNLLFLEVARRDPSRVLTIRYEDLRDRTPSTLRRLGDFLGIDPSPTIARLEAKDPLEVGHVIGGNDVRLEQGLRFDPKKETTRRQPPPWVRRMTVAFCFPLMRRFGYATASQPPQGPRSTEARDVEARDVGARDAEV